MHCRCSFVPILRPECRALETRVSGEMSDFEIYREVLRGDRLLLCVWTCIEGGAEGAIARVIPRVVATVLSRCACVDVKVCVGDWGG